MALTGRQIVIQELMVQRQELLADVGTIIGERNSAVSVLEAAQREERADLMAAYAARLAPLNARIDSIGERLRGDAAI